MEIDETKSNQSPGAVGHGELPFEVRQQFLKDAERYFPSELCPAHPQTQRAFASAKSDYIRERMRRWQKNSQTPQTSERCERDPANQQVNAEREASDMRAQTERIRSQASDASDTSDPADVVPPDIRAAMDFMARFNTEKASRLDSQARDVVCSLDPRSPLDHLPADKQRTLYEALCEFGSPAVNAVISKPEPEGWDIHIHVSSLKRFRERYAKRTLLQKENDLAQVAQLLKAPGATDETFTTASEHLLKLRLLETVNNPGAKSSEIRDLFHAVTRLRAQALAEKRLTFAAQKNKSGPAQRLN